MKRSCSTNNSIFISKAHEKNYTLPMKKIILDFKKEARHFVNKGPRHWNICITRPISGEPSMHILYCGFFHGLEFQIRVVSVCGKP